MISEFDEYLSNSDWRVKENSNSIRCLGSLNKYVIGKRTALHWESIYNQEDPRIIQYHRDGDFHIHDLGSYSAYCFGASLKTLLQKGIRGVSNISTSRPAGSLRAATAQIANIATIFQNEVAGAVAFSSWNVYLAPFIYFDALRRRGIRDTGKSKLNIEYDEKDLREVHKSVESMIYQLNSNSRMGSEPAFTNLTLDLDILTPMASMPIIFKGVHHEHLVYSDFIKEAELLLEVFTNIMLEGDGNKKPFTYPIPTFNISRRTVFEKHRNVFELAAKYGIPYFGNFMSSSLKEEDVYSMCCRLRLNRKELINKVGGLFGSAENTGSLGVVTLNLPAIGFRAKSQEEFFADLDDKLDVAIKSLIIKRKVINKEFQSGLYPALKEYLRSFDTFFLTIGILGGHECCLNFLGKGIETPEGREFILDVVHHLRERISEYQEKTGFLLNLEYTPAESAAYRLALKDRKRYPSIITAGISEPYYTNSVHLPVGIEWSYREIYQHQHGLLSLATGGSVYHNYLKEPTTAIAVEHFLKVAFENYDLPYVSFSPIYSICKEHGYLRGNHSICPICGEEAEVYQRVTGYIRPVKNFNEGKSEEFRQRYQKTIDSEEDFG